MVNLKGDKRMNETVLKPEDLRLLRCLSSEKSQRSQLVNRSGLPDTQARYSLERLIEIGFVTKKGRGFYVKTPLGYEFEKGRELPLELTLDNPELQEVIKLLPTQAHKTIFWFWFASIVAKKYLLASELFENYNPGFVVIGETGEIKSLIAAVICKVLGLSPEAEYIRDVITATRKEILGRKYNIGKGEYRLNPSPYFSRIAVCFDEIDKAQDKGIWQAILYYLNGRRDFEEEKTFWKNEATVLVSMNPSSKWTIPPEYLRRCFLLDTRPFDLDPRETIDTGEEIAHSKVPRVNIEGLKIAFNHLEKEDLNLLKDLLFEGLKDEKKYKRLVNPATLEKVVLGWLLLTQTHDKIDAIFWAVEGNLTLLQTQGATKEGWRRTLREKWAVHRSGKDPEFERDWKGEVEELEAEDQVIIDRDKDQEDLTDEKIDQKFDFKQAWEKTFGYWGRLIIRLDQMLPEFKRANRVELKAIRDEYSEYTAISKGRRDPDKLKTVRRLLERRKARIVEMLTEDIAEHKRLEAEKEEKRLADIAEAERKRAIIRDRSDTAANLASNLWNLDTSAGHRDSKQLRDSLKTIKDNPDTNYARTNFSRRKATALAMIERFTKEREDKGAPAAEQVENGVISVVCKIASIFTGKKTEESTSEGGEVSPKIPSFRGQPDEGLKEKFGYGEGEQGKPRPRRKKSIYEKLRNGDYKKKKGEPKQKEFEGRPWEDKETPGRPFQE